jgi:hypothetical protein
MSSLELSHEFDLRQKTCWEFKWKIQQAMCSSGKHPLTGTVHVDEFFVGEYEEGQTGRSSKSKQRLVVVGLEILDKGGVGCERYEGKNTFTLFWHSYHHYGVQCGLPIRCILQE